MKKVEIERNGKSPMFADVTNSFKLLVEKVKTYPL